jgi:hypothetical protein
LATLAITAGTGLVAASMLQLASQHSTSATRSGLWNQAIPVAEAGVEEALAHLNHVATNWSANGWTLVKGDYTKTRTLGSNYFTVTVTTNTDPVITSRGYMLFPYRSNYVSRAVRVTAQKKGVGMRGMSAKSKVLIKDFARTDSYNSKDPTKSTGGRYDPAKAGANGDVSSIATSGSMVELSGNAKVNGKLGTGSKGALKIAAPATVGSKAWTSNPANGGKVEPGWHVSDFKGSFPDVVDPGTGGAFTPAGGTVGGTNYTYVLTNGKYAIDTVALGDGKRMIVTGTALLRVNNTFDISGTGYVYIAPGANLQLYVNNSSAISGKGFVNSNADTSSLQYYGLKGNKQIYISGNGVFIGTIYAPSAKMDITGDGQFMGASVSDEIVLGGNFQFHYDEAMGGSSTAYAVANWEEL